MTTGTYLITGAAGGMGEATARRLSADGHRVVLTDVNERVDEVARQVGRAPSIVADLGDADAAARTVDRAFEIAGRLDGALLAAGLTGTFGPASRTPEEFDRMIGVNARGTLVVAEAIASRMAAARVVGSLVLISSAAAFVSIGQAAYSASKAAVEAIAKELAFAYAQDGIRVNTIAPGLIDTEMASDAKDDPEILAKILARTPLNRLGKADEIAGAVAFLLSDDASYVTGTTLRVDGGYLAI
jgi:NAD(P)-dependent dehydrogenase (short-subunit alcohol dehydrogenase family)